MKLLQDQGHARGGYGKDLELPGSASELPGQAVPDPSPAAAQGIHTFPWPRAAVQHQGQQSRIKCQTLLQVSTKAALKIQIKPAPKQGQYGGDRPRDAPAPPALCEHQSLSGSAAVPSLWESSEPLWAQTHPDTPWPHSAGSKPWYSRGLTPSVPAQPALPAGTASMGVSRTLPKPSVSTPCPPLSPSPHPTRLPLHCSRTSLAEPIPPALGMGHCSFLTRNRAPGNSPWDNVAMEAAPQERWLLSMDILTWHHQRKPGSL